MRVLIAAALLAIAAPAHAQVEITPKPSETSLEPTGAMCVNAQNTLAPKVQIDACTRLMQQSKDMSDGDRSAMLAVRASVYLEQNDSASALQDLNQAIRLNPNNAIALMTRGIIHYRAKNDAQASRDLSAAIALNTRLAPAYRTRGYLRTRGKDTAGAIADHTNVIALEPNSPGGYRDRGQLHFMRGDNAKALVDYDAAIKLSPKPDAARADLLNGACFARAVLNKELDRARKECDEAIRISATQAPFHDSRALVAFRQKRNQDAWNDWNAAIKLDAKAPGYLYGRGVAALKLGRKAEGDVDIGKAKQVKAGVVAEYAGYGVAP